MAWGWEQGWEWGQGGVGGCDKKGSRSARYPEAHFNVCRVPLRTQQVDRTRLSVSPVGVSRYGLRAERRYLAARMGGVRRRRARLTHSTLSMVRAIAHAHEQSPSQEHADPSLRVDRLFTLSGRAKLDIVRVRAPGRSL